MIDAAGALKPVSVGAGMDRCKGSDDGVSGPPVSGNIACLDDCNGSNTVAGSATCTARAQAPAWVRGQARAVEMMAVRAVEMTAVRAASKRVMDVEVVVMSVGQVLVWMSSSEGVVLVRAMSVEA
jgi:hypothetical protein